jgi:hypothetical protein
VRYPSPSESPSRLGVARSIIDPAYHTSVHEIDIDAVPKIAVLVTMLGKCQGGTEIIPVCGQIGVSGRIVRLPPQEA